MKNARTSIRTLLVGSAIIAGFAAAPAAQAQEAQPDRTSSAQAVGTPTERTEARLSELTQALKLSAEQVTQIRPILLKRYADSEALRSGAREGGSADVRAQRGTLIENTNTAILAVLTAEQKTAYQALLEQEEARQPGGGQGGTRGQGARGTVQPQS